MRAQESARIFVERYSYTLTERIMRTNKMCPATRARFVFYR